jgi:hypothetical protein
VEDAVGSTVAAIDAAPEVVAAATTAAATHRPIDAQVVVAAEDAPAPDHGVKNAAPKKRIQSIFRVQNAQVVVAYLFSDRSWDSGYEADDEVSVGYDGHGDGEQQELDNGGGNEQIMLFVPLEVSSAAHRHRNFNHLRGAYLIRTTNTSQVGPGNVGAEEHVAESMGAGGIASSRCGSARGRRLFV